jgi:hypothetical protein
MVRTASTSMLVDATSNRLRAQPHTECADNPRHSLEARITGWRERFVKAGSGDAGVLGELHHAARSSDDAECANQHLPIHRLFENRLEVVFDIGFGLQVIRRVVRRTSQNNDAATDQEPDSQDKK